MTQLESVTAEDEAMFLEDNIATVAFHLGQPGARMSVGYEGGSKLIVDPGEVLKEISRRLRTPSQPAASGAQLSALDDASNACLELAAEHGFATGHGDTVADMISEFSGQIGNRHAELQAEIERLTDEVGAYAMALEQCRHHTPAQSMPIPKGELTKIASECHRAKWQFDLSEDFQPSKSSARALILQAFHEIHRIGDIALKLRDATALSSTDGDQ